jgi:hypothetical protein
VPNLTLMRIEDYLFPSLTQIQSDFFDKPNKVVFVIGHPRSATTAIHTSLLSLP